MFMQTRRKAKQELAWARMLLRGAERGKKRVG